MTVTLTPNPATPGSTVTVEGAGFTPKLKTRIKDAGDVWRSRADGGFSVGLVVSTTPKTQTVVVQQQVSGAWVTAWTGTVTVQNAVEPPPPGPEPPSSTTIQVPSGGVGVIIRDHGQIVEDVTILGPGATAYRAGERAIQAIGTATNPLRDIVIRRVVARGFGDRAIFLQYVESFTIYEFVIDDCVYAGLQVLSGIGGTIRDGTVRRIGMNAAAAAVNSYNAYGVAITVGANGPMSQDVMVQRVTVEDVPTWEAFDTHGGQRITFEDGIVRRSRRGVMLTSGNGTNATDCKVLRMQFLDPRSRVAGEQYAVAPVNSVNSVITGNTITGWGADRDLLRSYPNPGLVYTGNVVTP